MLSASVRDVLLGAHLANLVTINRDGSPQISVVWVGLEGDEIVTAHLGRWQKVRNVERDGRVALSIVTGKKAPNDLDEYLVIHGTARVEDGGAPQLLQQLAHTYIGPDMKFPPMDDPPEGYVLHITVDSVGGNGDWQ